MPNSKKRLFTQRELEKHINARLMRERKKNSELEALKRMLDELMESGQIDADSYAEAGERLISLIAENRRDEPDKETDTVEDVPVEDAALCNNDTDVHTADDFPFEEAEDAQTYDPTDTADNAPGGDAIGEISENVSKIKSETEENINLRLASLCSELADYFVRSVGGNDVKMKDTDASDECLRARRAASSTGFSVRSASDVHSDGSGLTPTQRDIARRAGISYKEYAGLLREIPDNIKKIRSYR